MLEWISVFLCILYLVVLCKRKDLNSLKISICGVMAAIDIVSGRYVLAAMWVLLALGWILIEMWEGR